ncbi:MAG TPA: ABC transporter permease [Stellaceae bacterium]|nr:ABC transporter permease [Stellaceae bacterium]
MSTLASLPHPVRTQAVFFTALDSGDLDTCLDFLRRDDNPGSAGVSLNCRLSEILFHRGRREQALECGRRALAFAAGDDADTARFCAWLFSNCACHDEAALAYERLLDLDPSWVEGHRHASGSLAAGGALDRAIPHAVAASDLAPDHGEFALHAGCVLLDAGYPDEAIGFFRRALDADPDDNPALRALSAALLALDRQEDALAVAVHAAALAPGDAITAIHACELLMRRGRLDDAAATIEPAAVAGNPTALRVLSGVEMARDRDRAALAAIDGAIAVMPAQAEFHLHRGHALAHLGEPAAAAQAFGEAAALDTNSREAKHGQLAAYLAGGQLTEATALGGQLLRQFPDDAAAAAAVLDLLQRRLGAREDALATIPKLPSRRPRPQPGLLDGLRCQCRVLHALIIRETRTRFGEARLGYGWALIEPILHITVLWVMFSLLMHGQPPIGRSFFVFYFTGLLPYHIFVHTSGNMIHAIPNNGSLLQLPLVTKFDVVLARGILEFVTDLMVALILLIGFCALGFAGAPDDVWNACLALGAVAALGCGAGFVNAVIAQRVRSWDKIWTQATRVLYFASGIFYAPAMMPDWVRQILVWNPVLQAIDWFRSGCFAFYHPHWLDRTYLSGIAITALLAGFGIERALRRRISEPL